MQSLEGGVVPCFLIGTIGTGTLKPYFSLYIFHSSTRPPSAWRSSPIIHVPLAGCSFSIVFGQAQGSPPTRWVHWF